MDSGHCGNASSVSFLVISHVWPRSKVDQTQNKPQTEVSWARFFICVDVLGILGKVHRTQQQPQTSARINPNSNPTRPQIGPKSTQHRAPNGTESTPDSSLKRCPNRLPQIGPTGFPSKDGTGRSTGVKRNSVKDGCSCVRAC